MLCPITRARDRLYLTCCRQRLLFGTQQNNMPSRFLREIAALRALTSGLTGKNPLVRCRWHVRRLRAPPLPPGRWHAVAPLPAAGRVRAPLTARGGRRIFPHGDRVRHKYVRLGRRHRRGGEGADRKLTVAFEGRGIHTLKEAVAGLTRDA